MIKKIVPSTDPALRQKSKAVKVFDKKIKNLAKDLKDTLKVQTDPEGVGLAGCQIGKNLCIFAMEYQGGIKIIINPKILAISKKREEGKKGKKEVMEGCLSVPNYYGPLHRAKWVKIKFQDEEGKEHVQTFSDFSAQIVLHEIDHLNGILFVDHLLKEGKYLYEITDKGWEEVRIL